MLSRLKLLEERSHRATYVGILNQCLSQRGSKKALADRVGITPQHLSYLLVLDDDPDNLRSEFRTPSPALARRITEALQIEEPDRAQLLAHMLAARSGGWKTARGAEPEEASSLVAQLVPVLTGFWARIRVSPHPEEIHTLLEAMLGIGEIVTKCLVSEEERIETIELHLNLARAEDVRGRPRQALYHANHAHTSLEFLSHGLRRGQVERVGELELQALVLLGRLQGQGNNLSRALFYLDKAQELAESDEGRKLWRARIAAARGTAKVACGRFVLRDLKREIESVKPLLEKCGSEEERLLVEMSLHLAQAYIATENPDHAQFHLDAIRGLMRDSQRMGIMDYASYALHLASLWILQGREAGRIRHLVEDAEEAARRAGLESLERALRELKSLILEDEKKKRPRMT